MTPPTSRPAVDVAIIGSGPIGATVAQQLRLASPHLRITMVEAGPRIGSIPGEHLLTAEDPEAREIYVFKARPAVQTKYVGTTEYSKPLLENNLPEPGVIPTRLFGEHSDEMPGTALAWNVGGMGVHWTAASPWPFADEIPDFLDAAEWAGDLATAQALFSVRGYAYPVQPSGARVLQRLGEEFPALAPGREVQPMPLAGRLDDTGLFHRAGPADILPVLGAGGDESFDLLADTLCTRIDADDTGATLWLRSIPTGDTSSLRATAVVVAADTLQSPQLLVASGLGGEAVGRYLNEHVFLSTSSVLPADLPSSVDRPDDPFVGVYWLPSAGDTQPFHGQMMETVDSATGRGTLGLSWYVKTEVRPENRIVFSGTETDILGMPAMTFEYSLSAADRDLLEQGRRSLARAAEAVGEFDPATIESLPLGGSLHYTGTVRIGPVDDGTSVADADGRVWGTGSVFVAGNGAVPTALTCNSTLTAAVLAVRTARAVAAQLANGGVPTRSSVPTVPTHP